MRQTGLLLALLMIVTGLLYLPTLRYPAVYEDLNDPETFLTAPSVRGFAERVRIHPTRTVTELSFDVTRVLFGPESMAAYHAGSVALHLVNVALVGLIAWQAFPPLAAVAVAIIFAAHPLNVEAVAYISARADLVATSGLLVALLATSLGSTAWVCVGVLLACFGKETAVMGLAFIALWAWATGRPFPMRVWLLASAGLILGVVVLVLLRIQPGLALTLDFGVMGRAAASVLRLTSLLWVPIGLSIDHDWNGVPLWLQSVSVGAIAALTCGALWTLQHGVRWWAIAWLVTLTWCLPRFVLPVSEGLHEHHFYFLTAVWSLCAGAWLSRHLVRAGV